jgi:hypothetical protein
VHFVGGCSQHGIDFPVCIERTVKQYRERRPCLYSATRKTKKPKGQTRKAKKVKGIDNTVVSVFAPDVEHDLASLWLEWAWFACYHQHVEQHEQLGLTPAWAVMEVITAGTIAAEQAGRGDCVNRNDGRHVDRVYSFAGRISDPLEVPLENWAGWKDHWI